MNGSRNWCMWRDADKRLSTAICRVDGGVIPVVLNLAYR